VQEILRTNDPVLISYIRSLLMDAGIDSVAFYSHIANMEGSVSAHGELAYYTHTAPTERKLGW